MNPEALSPRKVKIMSIRSLSFALLTTLAVSVPASAATIVDWYDPADVYMRYAGIACTGVNGLVADTSNQTAAGCTTLTYDQILTGYTAPPDTNLVATLTVYFSDDNIGGNPDGNDPYQVRIGSSGVLVGSGNATDAAQPLTVSTYFDANGFLNVRVSASAGSQQSDFLFLKSVVNASWTDGVTEVSPLPTPEPASLLLFGTGAAAVVAQTVRKRKRAVNQS
jgi:hypothetical protein